MIPNLWGAVVGRPSLLKSPTIDEVMKPLKQLADEAVRRNEENEKDFKEVPVIFLSSKDDLDAKICDLFPVQPRDHLLSPSSYISTLHLY